MTDKEFSQRTGELLQGYFAAKKKVELLKLDAAHEAKARESLLEKENLKQRLSSIGFPQAD